MNKSSKLHLKGNYQLESGQKITDVQISYHTYGQLNKAKDNVIWVCHSLRQNSDVLNWWAGLFGENDLFNPEDHFIVCANVLGSSYGTTGPLSLLPNGNEKYHHDFPDITIRDIVGLHKKLADHLNIETIQLLLGSAMGGQQALEWAIVEPKRIKKLALIATNATHSPWAVAFNTTQRMAISSDPSWRSYDDKAGSKGVKVAQSIASLSHGNFDLYQSSLQEYDKDYLFPCHAVGHQLYQGENLPKQFNAFSYWILSKAMDSMNIGRNRGGLEKALALVEAKTLVLSLEKDLLFPKSNQLFLAKHIPRAIHKTIASEYGHGGYLKEIEKLSEVLEGFLYPSIVSGRVFRGKTFTRKAYRNEIKSFALVEHLS